MQSATDMSRTVQNTAEEEEEEEKDTLSATFTIRKTLRGIRAKHITHRISCTQHPIWANIKRSTTRTCNVKRMITHIARITRTRANIICYNKSYIKLTERTHLHARPSTIGGKHRWDDTAYTNIILHAPNHTPHETQLINCFSEWMQNVWNIFSYLAMSHCLVRSAFCSGTN